MKNLAGQTAPDFKLQDQNGAYHSLKDYRGNIVLLYFYPKDMTPGCTIEAQCFRDRMNDFKGMGVQVLGVSADDVESHAEFAKAHKLNFPLLADVEKKVIDEYGVWKEKNMYGKKFWGISRESFLIDRKGVIAKHYGRVQPEKHPEQVLRDLEEK